MPYSVRYVISKRERKKLISELQEKLPKLAEVVKNSEKVERAKLKGGVDVILANGLPIFVYLNDKLIPTLALFLKYGKEGVPFVMVDKGAVPHILNGADVMRPGIIQVSGVFDRGDPVLVIEERGYPIAICKAIFSSTEIMKMKRGKVLKNIHYIKDKLWKQLFGS